jgi:hypothetical protein
MTQEQETMEIKENRHQFHQERPAQVPQLAENLSGIEVRADNAGGRRRPKPQLRYTCLATCGRWQNVSELSLPRTRTPDPTRPIKHGAPIQCLDNGFAQLLHQSVPRARL